jgi:hypothetical protein
MKIAIHCGNLKSLEELGIDKIDGVEYLKQPSLSYYPDLYYRITRPVKRAIITDPNNRVFYDTDIIVTVNDEPVLIVSCKCSITDELGKGTIANCVHIKEELGIDVILLCRNPRKFEPVTKQRKTPVCFPEANFSNVVAYHYPYMMKRIFLLNDDPINQLFIHPNHRDVALEYYPHGSKLIENLVRASRV